MSDSKKDEYSEAEAQRRFEQALKGAANAPKKAKPPALKRERQSDHKGKPGGK